MDNNQVNDLNTNKIKAQAEKLRASNSIFEEWSRGLGPITHSDATQVELFNLAEYLTVTKIQPNIEATFELAIATDIIACTAMKLVAHMTYANNIYFDDRDLVSEDFKTNPEGHTGGSLNIAIAYSAYLLANALSSKTRGWLMGQGHCVAAIDSVNLIVDNLKSIHRDRYLNNGELTETGLSKFIRDFYSYELSSTGEPASPLGSHVNHNTAGGMMEGGYLGFAELYYPHVTLPGEELIAFLSDGAFEEQRGSDWAARWWRAKDCGIAIPVMIANGRRIDQRTTMAQLGGSTWLKKHLELNGFSPVIADGRDPIDIAIKIVNASEEMNALITLAEKQPHYPVKIPYIIVETIKGYGFAGQGTNPAHNLPLPQNPKTSDQCRKLFNESSKKLSLTIDQINWAKDKINNHQLSKRGKEKDNPIANRSELNILFPEEHNYENGSDNIPMQAVDNYILNLAKNNPKIRFRVGNPDELDSNQMRETLKELKHRVCDPEPTISESIHGSVITALNEECVVSAALANKGGLNVVVSYEAFAVKMLGALRQEIIWIKNAQKSGDQPQWTSIPIISTSHLWENGKNEISHQDPTLSQALMFEPFDVSRVLFPVDSNSAEQTIKHVYSTKGKIFNLVIPKRSLKNSLTIDQADRLVSQGALVFEESKNPVISINVIGGYQLEHALKAAERLNSNNISTRINIIIEPARFKAPSDSSESSHGASQELIDSMFKNSNFNSFICHGHPDHYAGIFLNGAAKNILNNSRNKFLGYLNKGGTLDIFGLMFANHCCWGDIVLESSLNLEIDPSKLLSEEELNALRRVGNPNILR